MRTRREFDVRLAVHTRDQKQVNDPTNQKQASSEKPERAGDRFSVIESVCTGESEDPEDVSDDFAVSADGRVHGAKAGEGLEPQEHHA